MWSATGLDGVEPHPESVRAIQRTAPVLDDLGHDVRTVALPAGYQSSVRQANERWFAIAVAAGVPAAVPAERRDQLTPYTRYLLDTGEALSGVDVMLVQAVLARYASAFLAAQLEAADLWPDVHPPCWHG